MNLPFAVLLPQNYLTDQLSLPRIDKLIGIPVIQIEHAYLELTT